MTIDKTWFKIGYIAKTHGLKGGVTIIFNKEAPVPKPMTTIFLEVNREVVPYVIEEISDRSDKAFVRFAGVTTPEQAGLLRGSSIYFPKTNRSKLERGEFYDDEVVGFEVEETELGLIGTIKEVLQMGPNRLLAIQGVDKEILIPVNGPFIKSINKSKKKFTVSLPDGFLEI